MLRQMMHKGRAQAQIKEGKAQARRQAVQNKNNSSLE